MNKKALPIAISTWAMIIAGCNGAGTGSNALVDADTDTKSSASAKATQDDDDYDDDEYDGDAETFDDLPKCTSRKDGDIYYIEEDDAFVECNAEEEKWVPVKARGKDEDDPDDSKPSSNSKSDKDEYDDDDDLRSSASKPSSSTSSIPSAVSTVGNLPTCTSSLENIAIYVEAANDYYYCSTGSWYGFNDGVIKPIDSGDLEPVIESSSSISHPYFSPSGEIPCGDMWCGKTGREQVNTGLGNETMTSGFWFDYGDSKDGGRSSITWPVAKGNEYDANSVQPIIAYCSGVCGTVSLNAGTITYNPYVGIGFNIVGESESGGSIDAGNASAWGGVCIVYSSDAGLLLEMGLGDAEDAKLKYGPPSVDLPKGEMVVKDLSWSDFEMPSWAVSQSGFLVTGPEASQALVALKIKLQGSSGSLYHFNVMSIGKYGTCK